jgi:hypothetical protein
MLLSDPARLRRIMLRLMLAALAASGALAILAVLAPRNIEPERMIATAVAAAIASVILFWSCKLLDSERTRPTGLLLMAFIIAQFILTLLAIWNFFSLSTGDEDLWLTTVLFPLVWLPATVFFHLGRRRGGIASSCAGLIACAATYLFFLAAIWLANQNDHLWATGWSCYLFAFAVSASLAGIGVNRNHWRWIGVGASVVAFSMALRAIWKNDDSKENALIIIATGAILIGHANLLLLLNLKPSQNWVRFGTIACAWVAGAIFDYAAINSLYDEESLRFGIAASICAGCGTVALALLAAFNRKAIPAREVMEFKELTLVCPACHKKQILPMTDSQTQARCPECGLQFGIQLRLPRCPKCDYSLLMLKSDRCPECGTPIAAETTQFERR